MAKKISEPRLGVITFIRLHQRFPPPADQPLAENPSPHRTALRQAQDRRDHGPHPIILFSHSKKNYSDHNYSDQILSLWLRLRRAKYSVIKPCPHSSKAKLAAWHNAADGEAAVLPAAGQPRSAFGLRSLAQRVVENLFWTLINTNKIASVSGLSKPESYGCGIAGPTRNTAEFRHY